MVEGVVVKSCCCNQEHNVIESKIYTETVSFNSWNGLRCGVSYGSSRNKAVGISAELQINNFNVTVVALCLPCPLAFWFISWGTVGSGSWPGYNLS